MSGLQPFDDKKKEPTGNLIRWGGGLFFIVFGVAFMAMPGSFLLSLLQEMLKKPSWPSLLPIGFLSIFVVVGGSIIFQGLRMIISGKIPGGKQRIADVLNPETDRPVSTPPGPPLKRNSAVGGKIGAVIFSALFVLIGAGILYAMTIKPLITISAAKGWARTPAVVTSSAVGTHDGDDGDTYSVDIAYTYQVNGKTYNGERYSFFGGSSSGYEGKRAIVDRYPVGSEAEIFYDPQYPEKSVIEPHVTGDIFWGLIPLAFIVFGLFFMVVVLKDPGEFSRTTKAWKRSKPSAGALVLRPGKGRFGKLFGLLFVALFWNGIVSVFVVQIVNGWASGNGEIGLTLFMIPFLLIGIAMIVGVVRCLMQLGNPKLIFTLDRSEIALGDPVVARLWMEGAAGRLQTLSVELIGQEEASYQRGTTTHTEKEEFCTLPLLELSMMQGSLPPEIRFSIPKESMHSFAAAHNKVIWKLCVKGKISFWPDVNDEYTLDVAPQRKGF